MRRENLAEESCCCFLCENAKLVFTGGWTQKVATSRAESQIKVGDIKQMQGVQMLALVQQRRQMADGHF